MPILRIQQAATEAKKAVTGGVSDIPTDPWGRPLFATPDVGESVDEGLQNVQENVDAGSFLGGGRAVPEKLEDLPFTAGETAIGPDLTGDGGDGNGGNGSDFPWMLVLLVAGLFALGTVVDVQHSTGGQNGS